ncbi:hypothetical protein ABS71_09970 [bacterium SCN 62-11]|nr:MAG: hypothetical protein ABS71_09970 [bacterium SCN 62-11]
MNRKKGFYSIIQHVADLDRAEGVNVGVVLAVPLESYLDVRLANPDDLPQLGLKARILREGAHWNSTADLIHFANCEGNHLRLVEPRTIFTKDAEKDLEALFQRLVGPVRQNLSRGLVN